LDAGLKEEGGGGETKEWSSVFSVFDDYSLNKIWLQIIHVTEWRFFVCWIWCARFSRFWKKIHPLVRLLVYWQVLYSQATQFCSIPKQLDSRVKGGGGDWGALIINRVRCARVHISWLLPKLRGRGGNSERKSGRNN
jgi:hypothetical protein